jgi:O-antigen/teichoic acid export membrane protein
VRQNKRQYEEEESLHESGKTVCGQPIPVKWLKTSITKLVSDILITISSRERLKALTKDPLYSNAIYLMLANMSNALFGFVFWIIVARFYSPGDVGLASATISAASLLTMLSSLGLGYGLIRFLGISKDSNRLINSSLSISGTVSIAAALVFIIGLGYWSPSLSLIRENPIYIVFFLIFVPISSIYALTDQALMASRRAGFILAKNLVFNILRLTLPIMLMAYFNFFGIIGSWGLAMFVALLVGIFWFLPHAHSGYHPFFCFNRKAAAQVLRFSFFNYLADLFWSIPNLILPIIVINLLGAEKNAYFYMAWAISSILTMIPSTVSTSLLAEGSYAESQLGPNIRRSLKMVLIILTPAVILVLAIADKLLLMFGDLYSQNAVTLLRLLAVSAFPLAVNSLYFSMKRVEKNLKPVILLTALAGVVTIGLSYLLLPGSGINGVGLAWLISQCAIATIIVAVWLKKIKAVAVHL